MTNKYYEEIYEYIKSLEIIDTHEHLVSVEEARDKDTDILKEYLIHYFSCDLISAGMSNEALEKVRDNNLPLMERWDIVEPYWELARNTGYGRALDISVSALYGIDKICRGTIEALNDKFIKSHDVGHYEYVLKEKSKIKVSLVDANLDCDKKYFRSVYRMDHCIMPMSYSTLNNLETNTGICITSFDDWLEACEVEMDRAIKKDAIALKCGLAYNRSLKFDRVKREQAEKDFNVCILNNRSRDFQYISIATSEKFQNYMMHYILSLANKRKLTYQFHTGLQEGNGNIIYNSDPALLSNLFIDYPDIKFDIFHIGYPYQNVVSALAKNFRNVFIDMCWAHIISPTACINALVEWLDAMPVNKICAFGGDYCFVDAIYGHQYMARVNVSKALATKVEQGVFSVARAKQVGKMLFYDNPAALFKIDF